MEEERGGVEREALVVLEPGAQHLDLAPHLDDHAVPQAAPALPALAPDLVVLLDRLRAASEQASEASKKGELG